jgi:hypothetical protein
MRLAFQVLMLKLAAAVSLVGAVLVGCGSEYEHPCREDEFVAITGACIHGDTIEMEFGDGVDRPHSGSQGV